MITQKSGHKTAKGRTKKSMVSDAKIIKKKRLSLGDEIYTLANIPISDTTMELLGRGASSVAFKVSTVGDSQPLILKRSRIHLEPNNKLPHQLTSELAIYKYIDTLPILERQFLVKCHDWRIYDGCSYAARGIRVSDPMKPSRNLTTCIDMLLDYRGPSLADWLNSRFMVSLPDCKFKRKPRQEPAKLIYSIIWQLALIFKILDRDGWLHIDAHPHNITVVNGIQIHRDYKIDNRPVNIHIPDELIPAQLKSNHIAYLPTYGIQIALIDYNLVLHPAYPIDIL